MLQKTCDDSTRTHCSTETPTCVDVEAPHPPNILRIASSVGESVTLLETLTDRLVRAGIYNTYVQWRNRHMRQSMGDSCARKKRAMSMMACTPLSASGWPRLAESVASEDSEVSHSPTNFLCSFKRTLTYWVVVSFIEGSALFAVWYGFLCIQGTHTVVSDSLALSLSLFGVVWFFIGSYLGTVRQKNWERGPCGGKKCAVWYCVAPCARPLSCDMLCWQSYLIGTIMWAISEATAFVHWGTVLKEQLFIYVPMTLGGVFFVAGGVCEVWDPEEDCGTLTRCTSWANFFGSVLFFLGSTLPMSNPRSNSLLLFGSIWPFFLGSVLFLGSSIGVLFSWENEMVGLSRSRKLDKDAPQHCSPRSNYAGIVTIVNIISATVATANLCLAVGRSHPHGTTFRVSQAVSSSTQVVLIHLLLMLTSVITVLPPQEQLRGVILAIRCLSALILANVLSTFATLAWDFPYGEAGAL